MNPAQQRTVLSWALGASLLLLGAIFWAFSTILLADILLVLVTWPLYRWLGARTRNRLVAAGLTTGAVVGAVVVPVGTAFWLAAREAADAANDLARFIAAGGLAGPLADLQTWFGPAWRANAGSDGEALAATLANLLSAQAQTLAAWVTSGLGWLLQGLMQGGVGVIVLATLYLEGPTLLAATRRFAPLGDRHLERLFSVLDQLAHNMAYGMIATSIGQGAVAALGFWLAGAHRVALLGLATAVCSQIPLVGSAVVWAPLAIALALHGSWFAAVFVAGWSLLLTASVDNVLKPLIYRHGLAIHPVLFLVAMLGGLATFGPAGLLFGPFVLVLFLTLYTLYTEDQSPQSPITSIEAS